MQTRRLAAEIQWWLQEWLKAHDGGIRNTLVAEIINRRMLEHSGGCRSTVVAAGTLLWLYRNTLVAVGIQPWIQKHSGGCRTVAASGTL
jgi:hypothetical protein